MTIERFEDILVWQKAKVFVVEMYRLFGKLRDFGFRDQMLRAVLSIMNNIAEGFERRGDKEFRHFLFIAKGSCGETRSMLYIAMEIGYLSKEDFEKMYELSMEISRMLSGFIKKLQ